MTGDNIGQITLWNSNDFKLEQMLQVRACLCSWLWFTYITVVLSCIYRAHNQFELVRSQGDSMHCVRSAAQAQQWSKGSIS